MEERLNDGDMRDNLLPGILGQVDLGKTQAALKRITEFQGMMLKELKAGVDYGIVPGGDKPTLLKPGAEKILGGLGLVSMFEIADKVCGKQES